MSYCVIYSSYGSVFKGIDKRDGKVVAIKVMAIEADDTLTALQGEINILKVTYACLCMANGLVLFCVCTTAIELSFGAYRIVLWHI